MKTKLTFFLLLIGLITFGQLKEYTYKRKLNGISEQWHKITLPNEIYENTKADLSDFRVFGIKENDTIEAPFILRQLTDKITSKKVVVKMLNTVKNKKGFYYTFKVSNKESINQILLDFLQKNFDWKIDLEGSNNQKDWFTILENQRIVAINNSETVFSYTKLIFPDSNYQYYRILVKSKIKPGLTTATILNHQVEKGTSLNYIKTKELIQKKEQETEIYINLKNRVPINELKIEIDDKFDYYRPLKIQYVTDSIKTQKGWKVKYNNLYTGTLSSINKNVFLINNHIAQQLKITIFNGNNQSLSINNIQIKGAVFEMNTRFTEKANYFLAYGNSKAYKPSYDIERFKENIPKTLNPLSLGKEIKLSNHSENNITTPMFKNKLWLWSIILIIIALLGWFSFGMLKD